MTITKVKLSGSTDGRPIKIAAASSPGTTIHTAVASTAAGVYDEIWLWVHNSDTVARDFTYQKGGTSAPDDNVIQTIPSKSGLYLVLPGLVLRNALVLKGFASVTNVITADGYVNAMS